MSTTGTFLLFVTIVWAAWIVIGIMVHDKDD